MKKILVFGSEHCPDCVAVKKLLDDNNVKFGYLDITSNLSFLKRFLNYREKDVFKDIKASGSIGIPFIVVGNDEKFLFNVTEDTLKELE